MALDRPEHRPNVEPGNEDEGQSVREAAVHHDVAVDVRAGEGRDHCVSGHAPMHERCEGRVEQDGAVALHRSFRVPGRAGCVADCREIVSCPCPRLIGVSAVLDQLGEGGGTGGRIVIEEHDVLEGCLRLHAQQGISGIGAREDDARAAVGSDVADLLRSQHHVDRIDDCARLGDPVVADHPLPRVLGVHGDAVSRLDAHRGQPVGELVCQSVDLGECERAVVADQCDIAAEGGGCVGADLAKVS